MTCCMSVAYDTHITEEMHHLHGTWSMCAIYNVCHRRVTYDVYVPDLLGPEDLPLGGPELVV